MDVEERDGEDPTSRQGTQPALSIFPAAGHRAPANDVVGVIDGFEQRIKVGLGPGLLRGGRQDQRQVGSLQTTGQ